MIKCKIEIRKILNNSYVPGAFVYTLSGSGGHGMLPSDEKKVFRIEKVNDDFIVMERDPITGRRSCLKRHTRLATEKEILKYYADKDKGQKSCS